MHSLDRRPARPGPRGVRAAPRSSTARAAGGAGPGGRHVAGAPCSRPTTSGTPTSRACRVHPRSRQWLSHMSTEVDLHPDFGPSYGDGPNYGIPITVVGSDHAKVRGAVRLRLRERPGALPARHATPRSRAAGTPTATSTRSWSTGARAELYETWNTRVHGNRWQAGSGAVWSLKQQRARARTAGPPPTPPGCRSCPGCCGGTRSQTGTSTTRSGSPPTSPRAAPPVARPARRRLRLAAGYPPMGARFRLKAGFSTARASAPDAREVVARDEDATAWSSPTTARRGSSRASRTRGWPDRLVADLKRIPASAFVAVDTRPLKVDQDVPRCR